MSASNLVRRLLCTLAVLAAVPGAASAQTRGTITGTVKDAAGKAQTGITVILTTPAGIDRRVASDVDGVYIFGGLAAGEYRLRIEDTTNQYAPWTQERIAVAAGDRKVVDVALQPRVQQGRRATISGTVIGPNGLPRAGVPVVLSGAGAEQRETSGPNGAYVFGNLAPGSYRIRVTQTDAPPFESDAIVIAAGAQQSLDVRLQPLPAPAAAAQPAAVPAAVPAAMPATGPGLEAQPNRWAFQYPAYSRYADGRKTVFATGGRFDPYNQHLLKADRPIGGSTFLNVNLQFNSTIDPGKTADGAADGPQKKMVYNQNAVAGAELFGGDSVFAPKRWAVRMTTVFNLNAANAGSLSFGNSKVKNGIEELFGEARVAVLGPAFDFVSVRGGMQNFNSDFRGFLFVDNQLGVRMFGNAGSNRMQYNAAYFSMRQRDPVSQLHSISTSVGQNVLIANVYWQDVGAPGYTLMANFHLNKDARPTPAGGELSVVYAGVHGDGHWGLWSVSHAFYQAIGHDDNNAHVATPGRASVNARMAAIEIARDSDQKRFRGSFLYASGDGGTSAASAGGFDAVTDNPNFAGGAFMFWTQQTIKIPTATGTLTLKQKFSLLPTLRDKFTERSNFFNPGLIVLNGGFDWKAGPRFRIVTNGSFLKFAKVGSLQVLTSAETFPNATIGVDLGAGLKFRPFVNENLFVVGGVSTLVPMGGFKTALGASAGPMVSVFGTFQLVF